MSIGFWTIIFFVILTSPHWILIQSICVIIHITLQSKAPLGDCCCETQTETPSWNSACTGVLTSFISLLGGKIDQTDKAWGGGCNQEELACFWHRKVSWPERSKWKVISSKSLHSSDRQTSCRKPGQQLSKQASFLINTWSLQSSSAEQELRESTSCLPIWGEAWEQNTSCGIFGGYVALDTFMIYGKASAYFWHC